MERLTGLLNTITPLLDLIISGPFRDYTLHNPGHSRKLVHLAEHMLEPLTIERMTALDLTVFIMACHLHDLGMSITTEERARSVSSPEFEEELRHWPQLWDDMAATRDRHALALSSGEKLDLELRLFQLQEAGLAAFLRRRHATRERYIQLTSRLKEATGRADLFSLNGVSFENELIAVCESHNLDVAVLLQMEDAYTERYPRAQSIAHTTLNVQFCAGLLRLVDILDFDRERTPAVLFESLGIADEGIPGSTFTLKEWNRQMAIHSLAIADNELIVAADSTHPAIERSIREYCSLIEREFRDTASVLRKNSEQVTESYRLRVPLTARAQVRSIGYTYKDFAFVLDDTAISNLLMGEGLYPNRTIALRELVQNAIDACRVRALVERSSEYTPEVVVRAEEDESGRHWVVVRDNGIGMDDAVLFEYFFHVGRSYYRSAEFDRLLSSSGHAFSPISRFGIGVASVFMIADRLEVRTANRNSPRADTTFRTVRVDSRFGLAFVTESDREFDGTEVRIRLDLREVGEVGRFLRSAGRYLRDTIRRPAVPLDVALDAVAFVATDGQYVALSANARDDLAELGVEPVVIELDRWSDWLEGRVIVFFFKRNDGRLTVRPQGGRAPSVSDFRMYIDHYPGNQLAVNGMVMQLKRLTRVLRTKTKRKLVAVCDVEIRDQGNVEHDVARQRFVGDTANAVRFELRRAISSGLTDLGVAARMVDEYLGPGGGVRQMGETHREALMEAVEREIPGGLWPVGLHRQIAARVGRPPSLVYEALELLIEAGRATNPTENEASAAEHVSS
jgi:hypothetical protein